MKLKLEPNHIVGFALGAGIYKCAQRLQLGYTINDAKKYYASDDTSHKGQLPAYYLNRKLKSNVYLWEPVIRSGMYRGIFARIKEGKDDTFDWKFLSTMMETEYIAEKFYEEGLLPKLLNKVQENPASFAHYLCCYNFLNHVSLAKRCLEDPTFLPSLCNIVSTGDPLSYTSFNVFIGKLLNGGDSSQLKHDYVRRALPDDELGNRLQSIIFDPNPAYVWNKRVTANASNTFNNNKRYNDIAKLSLAHVAFTFVYCALRWRLRYPGSIPNFWLKNGARGALSIAAFRGFEESVNFFMSNDMAQKGISDNIKGSGEFYYSSSFLFGVDVATVSTLNIYYFCFAVMRHKFLIVPYGIANYVQRKYVNPDNTDRDIRSERGMFLGEIVDVAERTFNKFSQ